MPDPRGSPDFYDSLGYPRRTRKQWAKFVELCVLWYSYRNGMDHYNQATLEKMALRLGRASREFDPRRAKLTLSKLRQVVRSQIKSAELQNLVRKEGRYWIATTAGTSRLRWLEDRLGFSV